MRTKGSDGLACSRHRVLPPSLGVAGPVLEGVTRGPPRTIPEICDSSMMDRWAGALYGDPCRECSFAFSTGLDESLAYLAGIREEFSVLLADAQGTERHPDLSWSVGSYVCHVADNVRIWAERLVGSAAGAKTVGAYDDNLLAAARSYSDVPLAAALWSIGRASGDWQAAVAVVSRGSHRGPSRTRGDASRRHRTVGYARRVPSRMGHPSVTRSVCLAASQQAEVEHPIRGIPYAGLAHDGTTRNRGSRSMSRHAGVSHSGHPPGGRTGPVKRLRSDMIDR